MSEKRLNADILEENNKVLWSKVLMNSTISEDVSTTEIPANLDNDPSEQVMLKAVNNEKLSVLGNFQRQTLNRLSFKGEAGPLLNRYRQTRFSSRRVRKRVVFKHGDCNVVQGNVAKRRRRYLQDIFTTLVDAQWRWTLLVFAMNFFLSWLAFAVIWWFIVNSHGDLDPKNFTNSNNTFTPCVEDIHGFTSCFLFSVETQHTIGYGSKHTTEECPEAIFVMCLQSMTGVILQAFMVGIVFAKLSRPKKRTQTLLFSRNAVICQRDGQPCLMFRVGDMRKSHIIEAHVRAQMIKRKVTREGELLPFFQTELKVGGDGEEEKIIFIWPTTIVHKIDQSSPLYHLSASDMLKERFEIIVMLEGVIESTGMTTQARSSYLPSEILWGHRFEHIITFRKETGEYEVNYTLFNNTYEVDTPLCSAADMDHLKGIHHNRGERTGFTTFPTYRDDSSSSLTTSSGSSLASSVAGIHIQIPTPPTPIPVMITEPDDSPRQDSVNVQPDRKVATFYTHDEDVDMSSTVPEEEGQEQDYYNKVLKDINSSLEKHRKSSVRSKERVDSRPSLSSQRIDSSSNIDGSTQSSTKPTLEHSPSTGALKKSSSRVTLNSRSVNSAENDSSRKQEPHHHHVNYNADEKNTDLDTIFSLKPNRLIRISPPRPDISDAKATNHYPHYRNPEEQV